MPVPHGAPLEFLKSRRIFAPQAGVEQLYGYRLLQAARAMDLSKMKRILVVGSGTGYDAVVLAKISPARIDAIDIDAEAVLVTEANALLHGVSDRVRAIRGDLFEGAEGEYDLILFSAPRPAIREMMVERLHGDRVEAEQIYRNKILTDPGRFDPEGRLLKRVLAEFPTHLKRGGAFLLMSEEKLEPFLPENVRDETLSTDPWSELEREGNFSIHKLTVD
jgi:SAM-dependent methyltransferase